MRKSQFVGSLYVQGSSFYKVNRLSSDRKLCDMRKNGEIPFTKHGTAKNSKITYRVADVAEVFASRDS